MDSTRLRCFLISPESCAQIRFRCAACPARNSWSVDTVVQQVVTKENAPRARSKQCRSVDVSHQVEKQNVGNSMKVVIHLSASESVRSESPVASITVARSAANTGTRIITSTTNVCWFAKNSSTVISTPVECLAISETVEDAQCYTVSHSHALAVERF